jgi:hypothetical protein
MSKATAAIEKAIKAKMFEVGTAKFRLKGYRRGSGNLLVSIPGYRQSEADVNQLQILEGQLETFKANLQMVIDREYNEAMGSTPKPAKKAQAKAPTAKLLLKAEVKKPAPKAKAEVKVVPEPTVAPVVDKLSTLQEKLKQLKASFASAIAPDSKTSPDVIELMGIEIAALEEEILNTPSEKATKAANNILRNGKP